MNNSGKRLLHWKALQIYFEKCIFANDSCRTYTPSLNSFFSVSEKLGQASTCQYFINLLHIMIHFIMYH